MTLAAKVKYLRHTVVDPSAFKSICDTDVGYRTLYAIVQKEKDMQNRYVGDVGDFGKYHLLKALCRGDDGKAALSLGVVWYLVPDENNQIALIRSF